jgi:two-component system chemotaxis sensor kinase CheA
LNNTEIINLIFQSDISTSPIITDISGRGIGLAIVKENIEKLGGTIIVDTKLHKGTTFKIYLPLTLATFRGTIIFISGYEFIVPTLNIGKVLRLKKDDVKTVENKAVILFDSYFIPLFYLLDILEIPGSDTLYKNSDFITVIIICFGEKRMAFCVDKVINEQEVLVKSLGKQLLRVRNISGATILGSGKVIPIINVSDLLKSAMKFSSSFSKISSLQKPEEKIKNILVVDDSITSRVLLKNILDTSGYRVNVAVDGMDALTVLEKEKFDLIISDVEMPRMNGLEFTEKIRSKPEFSNLPVILVTSLSSREDRERGIDVGADAYIIKSNFDQGNLLDTIKKLI